MRNGSLFKVATTWLIFLGSIAMTFAQILTPPAAYTHIAVNNGRWQTPGTWAGGQIPNDGAIVQIPSGKVVTIARQETARVRYLQIEGDLRMARSVNTRLYIETIFITSTGLFRIGDVNNPVASNRKAEVIFISDGNPIDLTWDTKEASRGMVSDGRIRIYGHPKTHMVVMANDAFSGQDSLDVNNTVPVDWEVGDEIVLTGTHFRRFTDSQEEKVGITGINGNVISIDQNLQYNHVRVKSDMNLHIANLSRNVIFRSETIDSTYDRGHIMIRNADTDIRHAAFNDLGRTNKAIPLDEIIVQQGTQTIVPGAKKNRRGRYSLHFHLNGIKASQTDPPSKVYGSVVTNAIGWGFVNHGSHVDFQRDVCYDFVGSAFVTENGAELGNFYDNIAIRGTGNGEYRPIRIVFMNFERPQPLSDFGFSGDGFWFQGSSVRVRNNIANGCNGSGMIWFTTGAVDINTDTYIGFPRDSVAPAYAGFPGISTIEMRSWNYDPNSMVISDLPILECRGFEAYGCLTGFRFRFNNNNNMPLYDELWYGYKDDIVPVPGHGSNKNYALRLTQEVGDFKFWNNEQGFRMRYTTKTDWEDVEVVNRLAYHPVLPYAGAEYFHQVFDNTIDTLLVDGYAVGGWVIDWDDDNTNEVVVTNATYLNYANATTWKDTATCDNVSNLSVPVISTNAARVKWAAHPQGVRILLRYKQVGTDYWAYSTKIGSGTTGTVITGLNSGETYQLQAIAGCPESVSNWSNVVTFNTLSGPTIQQGGNTPLHEVQLYPNPNSDGRVFVKIPKELEIYDAQLIDLQGRLVLQPNLQQLLEGQLKLEGLKAKGIYLLSLNTNEGTKTLRLIYQ